MLPHLVQHLPTSVADTQRRPCRQVDAARVAREYLLAGRTATYRLEVRTGGHPGAETDCEAYVRLHGAPRARCCAAACCAACKLMQLHDFLNDRYDGP